MHPLPPMTINCRRALGSPWLRVGIMIATIVRGDYFSTIMVRTSFPANPR
jgi:hypothetical protein